MEKTRLLIPEGLAETPPGPELAAVLAEIDLSRLGGLDCVTVMRAQHRQVAHEQARLMAAMVEVARCGIGPDDQLPRMAAPDEFSADEIRGALVWTRAAATTQLSLAWDLLSRLPQVFAALDRGAIDVPKGKVFSEWTSGLTEEQARRVCEELLPDAPELTTGQLIDRIKKMAIAIDPEWARRRYEEAVRDRKVIGYRNADGSANLCGYQLPADRAAAACAHLDALAKKIKHAGDGRPIAHIRADLYLAMLDGSYTGWSEPDIIAHMLGTAANAPAEQPDDERRVRHLPSSASSGQPRRGAQEGRTPSRDGAEEDGGSSERHAGSSTGRGPADQDSDQDPSELCGSGGSVIEGPWPSGPQHPAPPPTRRAGVEIRAEVTTLLGLDDHPGEIPGSGPIHADLARRLVREQTAAEWRYAITDDNGRLHYEGITRRRPKGFPSRAEAPARGGIVELQISLSALRQLAARPGRLGDWATVIADLANQADQQGQADRDGHADQHGQADRGDSEHSRHRDRGRPDHGAGKDSSRRPGAKDERGPRAPGKSIRRRTEIRDRTCTHPRCRMPAHGTDSDHTEEWAKGGATSEGNIGSACRHDHRLRHEGGWIVQQPEPGYFIWTSRLGVHYHARPPMIIQPLPDPIPRKPPPRYRHEDHVDQQDVDQQDVPTWREPPGSRTEPGPSPPPDPDEPIPF